MGLIQPAGPSWAYCTHNLPSSLDPAALGVSCTAGANNADGTAVTLLAALAHDVEFLTLRFSGTISSGKNNNALMDLLIDPAGGTSWATLIADLIAGGVNTTDLSLAGYAAPVCGYDFPVWIPAGASLGLQIRSAAATVPPVYRVYALARGGNRNPASWWCGQRVTSINVSPSTSNGGTHTPGSSGAFSSWTDFGSPLGAACGALQWGVGAEDDNSWLTNFTSQTFQFDFGVGGQQIGPPVFRHLSGGDEKGVWLPTGPIFHQLAAGTQLQVRAAASGTPGAMGVAAYAVH